MKRTRATLFVWLICFCTSVGFAQVIHGTYAIKNVQTGLLLRPQEANKADGTTIVAYSPVNWKCVTWDFRHVDGETYQLKNLFTSKTLQPAGKLVIDGVGLEQQPLKPEQANQEYEFISVNKDQYRIKLKGTELYITDAKGAVNSRITLTKKTGAKDQLWTIYEQDPTM